MIGLASGIGSAVSGIANAISGGIQAKKKREYDKRESELAYQRSIEARDNEREYQSPTAQMQRTKEAGLNPHLIYGQGSSVATGSGKEPTYSPAPGTFAQTQIPNIGGMINQFQDFRLKEQQINQAKNINIGQNLENTLKMGHVQKQLSDMPEWTKRAKLETGLLEQNVERHKQGIRESKANEIFQRERGRLAKLGIFSGDDWRLRAIVTMAQEMNIDFNTIINGLIPKK